MSTNSAFFAPRFTGGPQTPRINLNRHRSGSRTFVSARDGLEPPVADLSILPSPDRHWLGTADFCYFETDILFFYSSEASF